ncbi:GreA/GreB family elongation factor [Mycoplasma yeatsii]|uniref:Transcription elongation GreA/GreB family factor n=1 Tax=Mycoplasma yeatsii TaxID=51365 RepID=A0ABU0NEK6_9MOLU|nr:GreA/GreB family elongation factor [Mycoplasma yeatsii]MDQ0567879.1 transcription elongation GreA/GreB family factor [Mycoplasma yeatsii]
MLTIGVDYFSNLISIESPIAKAMLVKKVGITVQIEDISKLYRSTNK